MAVIETGTGGDVAARLVRLPLAASVFRGGVISDDPAALAADLAQTARQAAGQQPVDWGLGVVVHMAGDQSRLEIALAGAQDTETQTLGFGGHPALVVRWVGTAALNLLRLALIRQ